ncbi:hypothetical protein [Microbacterium sp. K36]|uniref:hypothetical protein n=1 Tax=Microbacterium sp. K36 TaxID=2305439 RepID=UPI00109C9616|nr:hypothetical protein [Microbacterium sp. K36]
MLEQISKLATRVDLTPVVRWGTVTQTVPLRVRLDGDTEPLPLSPQNAVGTVWIGERVVVVEQHRRVVIVAAPSPPSVRGKVVCAASGVTTVTLPAGKFPVVPHMSATPVMNSLVGAAHITGLTTTSFEVRLFSLNGTQIAGTVDWTASMATGISAGG